VVSLDLKKGLAILSATRRPLGTISCPLRETSVTMIQKWGEKRFSLPHSTGCLLVTYGWCKLASSVYGYEIKGPKGRPGQTSCFPAFGSTLCDQRLERSHEAPCLRLMLDKEGITTLHKQMASSLPSLQRDSNLSPDLTERFQKCKDLDPVYVAIHTFLHQIIAVVPLLLLSSQDVEEGTLSVSDRYGYLVDSCDGGTGVCEEIFNNFLAFVAKAKECAGSCQSCQQCGVWGCATCIFQQHCPAHNEGLASALGAELFRLDEPKCQH